MQSPLKVSRPPPSCRPIHPVRREICGTFSRMGVPAWVWTDRTSVACDLGVSYDNPEGATPASKRSR